MRARLVLPCPLNFHVRGCGHLTAYMLAYSPCICKVPRCTVGGFPVARALDEGAGRGKEERARDRFRDLPRSTYDVPEVSRPRKAHPRQTLLHVRKGSPGLLAAARPPVHCAPPPPPDDIFTRARSSRRARPGRSDVPRARAHPSCASR